MGNEIKWTLGIMAVGIIGCKIFFDAPILDSFKEIASPLFVFFVLFQIFNIFKCEHKEKTH